MDESLSLSSSARRECGLVAGDQSAARLARVIIGHVGGDVHTVAVARELVVDSFVIRGDVSKNETLLYQMGVHFKR